MERYPEYKFACSQAHQYDWVRQNATPTSTTASASASPRGQWVPVGGTWIEPDCNLPSGESLVRQFLLGQRFFEREFGRRYREFWNPDVFGYNGQLPQIMRGAGIDRFLTQKLSWNRFNQPPHHTFTWQGIDGTEVLAHFPPADTYNAEADGRGAAAQRARLQGSRPLAPQPAALRLRRRRRRADADDARDAAPRRAICRACRAPRSRTPDEFFTALEADAPDRPTIVGELYFEYHRGTYTTQAAVKRGNREGEQALHDAELLAAIAGRLHGGAYPPTELDHAWELLLLNQFHDILPGSSIAPGLRAHRGRARRGRWPTPTRPSGAALDRLAGEAPRRHRRSTRSALAARGVAEHPHGELAWIEAPAYGFGRVPRAPDAVTVTEADDAIVLQNELLRAEIGRDGLLHSLVERATGREALAEPGQPPRSSTTTGRSTTTPGTSTRSTSRRAADCAAGPRRSRVLSARRRCAPSSPSSGASAAASSMRQMVRLDAGAPPPRVPLRGRLARSATRC